MSTSRAPLTLPIVFSLAAAMFAAACGADGGDQTPPSDGGADTSADAGDSAVPDTSPGDAADAAESTDVSPDPVIDAADATHEELDSAPAQVPEGCNPLAWQVDCMLPYPTDFFLVPDVTMPNGVRFDLTEAATPLYDNGRPVDMTRRDPTDGFSHYPVILALFDTDVARDNLVFHLDDPSESVAPTSPTLLIDATTGEPVEHWAELDMRDPEPGRQALIIRPRDRLQNSRRYVVAIHDLVQPNGEPVPAPAGFRELRDGADTDDPALRAQQPRFDAEVFPLIEAAGLDRSDLLLAWDFTTESLEWTSRDLVATREDAIARMRSAPPAVEIVSVEEGDEVPEDLRDTIFRRIIGTVTVPMYTETAEPIAPLHRGADGLPAYNGDAQAPFTILIPHSVAASEDNRPARLLQFGHGFFGSRREIEDGPLHRIANDLGLVVIAADWWGMMEDDRALVIMDLVEEPSIALGFLDRTHQAFVNFATLIEAAKSSLLDEPSVQIGGAPVYDPNQVYFYGISQGHILGATYLAWTPHIDRGVLGVGGASFTFMMSRASAFAPFLGFVLFHMPDPVDVQKFISLASTPMDRVDPITYAPFTLTDTFDDSPDERRVLLQYGIGDSTVPNLASELHARALGLPLLAPFAAPVAGLATVDAPTSGSAVVNFDFGVDPLPAVDAVLPTPSEATEVHESVRRSAPGQQQIDGFLHPNGEIANHCDGPCDPE